MPRWEEVVDDLTSDLAALAAAKMPEATGIEVSDLFRIPGGGSRESWSFSLRWRERQGERCEPFVVQRSPDGGLLDTDRSSEFRIIEALNRTNVPAPRALWLDECGDWLRRPAFVMGKAPGRVGGSYLLGSEFESQRQSIAHQAVDLAVALHAVDFRDLGFDPQEIPAREDAAIRQVRHWEAELDKQELEPHPVLREAFAWLRKNAPVAERLSLVHGDFKFENTLVQDGKITALLDWEMAHIGDPMEDLAWAYRWYAMTSEMIPEEEYLALYEERSRTTINREHLDYYRLFTLVKAAIIGLSSLRPLVDGTTQSNPRPGGILSMAVDAMSRLNQRRVSMEKEARAS